MQVEPIKLLGNTVTCIYCNRRWLHSTQVSLSGYVQRPEGFETIWVFEEYVLSTDKASICNSTSSDNDDKHTEAWEEKHTINVAQLSHEVPE